MIDIQSDIFGILNQFQTIRKLASMNYEEIKEYTADGLYDGVYGEIEAIIEEFSDAVTHFNQIKEKNSDTILIAPIIYKPYKTQETKKVLLKIIVGCDKAIGFLQKMELPISESEIQSLKILNDELEKISSRLEDINYNKNLRESIKECESGHHLASVLISSRVIQNMLEKVPGKNIEEKIVNLKSEGIIRDRKDVEESIIKSSKLSRNYTSHRIENFPSPTESISILSDSITLLKLLEKFL